MSNNDKVQKMTKMLLNNDKNSTFDEIDNLDELCQILTISMNELLEINKNDELAIFYKKVLEVNN